MEDWFDRFSDWTLTFFLRLGLATGVVFTLRSAGLGVAVLDAVGGLMCTGLVLLGLFFPMWLSRSTTRKQPSPLQQLSQQFVAVGSWITSHVQRLLGAIVLLGTAAYCLKSTKVLPDLTERVFLLTVFSGVVVVSVTLLMRSYRSDCEAWETNAAAAAPPPPPPPPPRGNRRWKPNIYGENAYAILDIPQNATPADVRAAFKMMAQMYHPHAVPPEEKDRATILFERVDQAYRLLSSSVDRARYDAWIEAMDGDEPALDRVTECFADPQQCAEFDRVFKIKGTELADDEDADEGDELPSRKEAPNEELPPPPVEAPPTPVPASASPEPAPDAPPVEVDMPDAVREALGLPKRTPPAG